ncbi:MAG: glycosyltransferase family 2 protein [Syntrophaceae bacterium]
MDISFVILTWNSQGYIKRCVSSYAVALDKDGLSGEFLIVDNGSQDNTLAVLRDDVETSLSPNHAVKVIPLKENVGTTVSRNMAIRRASGKFIIVCDSDTEFSQGSFLPALDYLMKNPEVGIVAPLLLWPDGEPQPTVRRFPTLIAKVLKVMDIVFHLPVKNIDFYPDFPWDTVMTVQTAASAFWILNKGLVEKVGYFDEKIFYSPEDLDYCFRIWRLGLKVVFYPDIKIIHHAQRLSRRNPFSRHALSHFGGLLYFFRKHGYMFRSVD